MTLKLASNFSTSLPTFGVSLLLLAGALNACGFAQPVMPLSSNSPISNFYSANAPPSKYNFDPAVRLAQSQSLPGDESLAIDGQQQARSILPPGTRRGVFQKANFIASDMPQLEGDSFGVTGIETSLVFGLPFPERESPLLITPRYGVLFLDGPDSPDVPPRLHEAELGLQHFRKLTDRWLFNGAVTLGFYADDHSFDADDAFRITGRALGIYDMTSCWKGIIGVVYLNRAGYTVVPAAGIAFDNGEFQLDLVFPRPRIAWLLPGSTPTAGDQHWFFIQGELGGNRWAVQRTTGAEDVLSYGDIRLLLGYEHKVIGGVSQRWELGYAFNRELEYDNDNFDTDLDDSLFVRGGLTY